MGLALIYFEAWGWHTMNTYAWEVCSKEGKLANGEFDELMCFWSLDLHHQSSQEKVFTVWAEVVGLEG